MSQELSQLVAECLSVRREKVRAQLVRDSCNVSHCHLTDYDWKLKVSTCTYMYIHVYTLPQLALYCEPAKKAGGTCLNSLIEN